MIAPRQSQRPTTPSDHKGILIASAVMIIVGWLGLYKLVTTTLPLAFPRWLFFILLFTAVTGSVLPFLRYFNMRLTPANYPALPGGIILRQSIWCGLYAVTCAWLQIPRVLNLPVAFFLALSFIVIEVYLRLRERSEEGSINP
ncbi:hypothetical protein ACFLYO_05405 [Chloroflexota bacterium]